MSIASCIDAGTVRVNNHGGNAFPLQPVGGVKWSGVGLELGPSGYLAATNTQVLHSALLGR